MLGVVGMFRSVQVKKCTYSLVHVYFLFNLHSSRCICNVMVYPELYHALGYCGIMPSQICHLIQFNFFYCFIACLFPINNAVAWSFPWLPYLSHMLRTLKITSQR